ncbi:unnamed protein product [Clonostachys rosea]|uniref:Uncharacterized protein n=1 Tax=Bionectria ochroleuca TaxID=29856 RepID=A0ABY6TQ10_BIOOC|nr:unnamed protein product [Clonostachys rosea]
MNAPAHHVKMTLAFLCKNTEVEKAAIARLDALAEMDKATAEAPGNKRKATGELAVCIQCENAFPRMIIPLALARTTQMEVDEESDFWADHDEDTHGEIDSDEARKEYPGGFTWSCCEVTADGAPGCITGRHESDPEKAWKDGNEDEEA